MQLLIAVINHEERVDDILAGFVELGITGATIIPSKGMGRVLSSDVPIFAGLRSLSARSESDGRLPQSNRTNPRSLASDPRRPR